MVSNPAFDPAHAASALLADARKCNRVLDSLPEGLRPRSLAQAYAIQDALAERLGWGVGGWFCACVNPEIQRRLGLDEPYYGRAVSNHQFASPARLLAASFPPISLECEFAFRLARDLPAREAPYGREEVEAAVATVHPAIEAVAGYLKDWITQDVFSVVADNGTDGPLIYGAGITDLSATPLDAVNVELWVNGACQRTGTGAHVGGNPLEALTWLANARSRAGDGLQAGYLHNTGTATDLYWAAPGDQIVADFGPLGKVGLVIE